MAPASTAHSDAHASEKGDPVEMNSPQLQEKKAKKGLFSKSKSKPKTNADDASSDEKGHSSEPPAKPEKDIPPASFASLFR